VSIGIVNAVFTVFGAFLVVTYLGTLRLRAAESESRLYGLFKRWFPVFGVGTMAGFGVHVWQIGRFEPVVVLGMSVELSVVRLVGSALGLIGIAGCMATLMAVGYAIDIRKKIETRNS
jgi:hypothetical protein